jgi:signal transduction histidine kinase/ligand-binding sensor domain-containing protein/CheY-like chemotaxis protein
MIILKTILVNWNSCIWKLIFLFIPLICNSQGDYLRFKRISNQDGLSQNWVRCIYQDKTGYMWFGTSGGLNRYDGYEFKVFSLGGVNVNAVIRKSEEELWICNDLGVYIYNIKKDSISSFSYFKGQTVLCILQDNDKKVWFGTNIGLYKYDALDNSLISYTSDINNDSSLSNNYINSLFQDSENNLWIGTKIGLNLCQKSTQTFKRYLPSGVKGSISGNDIMSICEDHNKRIWIGTAQDGVNLLINDHQGNVQFKQIVDGYVVSIMVDHQNNLWIGRSSNGGLLKLKLNDFSPDKKPVFDHYLNDRIDPKSLSDNSVFCIFEDYAKDIWIGTFGGGVNFYSPRSKKFYSIEEGIDEQPSIKNNLVNAIWEEERYLWIGTEVGLDRYDKIRKTSKHFQYESENEASLGANPVYCLLKDSRENFWVGTWTGGLDLYNYKSESFKRFIPDKKSGSLSSGNVFSIYEDTRGNLWVGTIGGGLNLYDYNTGKFKHYQHDPSNPKSLFYDVVNDIIETNDGRLLVSSFGALDIYNYNTDNFTHYPIKINDTINISNSFITSIFVDNHGHIWIGTNQGLALFDEKEKYFFNFTIGKGLPGNIIQGILEDSQGNLWISTNKGLSMFRHGTDVPDLPIFVNFSDLDGLSGNEFKRRSYFKNSSGYMYFGTSQGVTYFHPDSICLNKISPTVVLIGMHLLQSHSDKKAHDKSEINNINNLERIDLSYNNSDFIIRYAVLNYMNSENNKYKYKLNGYDKDWVNAENSRIATYKNLQHGSYTFMVLGSNNDGVWSETPKTLQIVIHPPWWKTWAFKIIFGLLFIALLISFYRVRFSILNRQKKLLESKVAERTQELSKMNSLLQEKQKEITKQNVELDDHRNHLEQLVEKRTYELEIAKVKAEESDRVKTVFLHNISHEIRTPLNAIIGFSNFLKEPDLSVDDRVEYADIICDSGDQLLSIITDIINIATLEAGKEIVIETNVNINFILKNLYTQYEPITHLKNISLSYHPQLSDNDSFILTDQTKFTEILSNLINNAIKFTDNGSINYGYKLKNGLLEFYIEDTGIGIQEDSHERIFERFRQVETTASSKYGGTGLGLSISKSYTEMLGGKIWLNSQIEKGTVFYFTIPYKKASQPVNSENVSETIIKLEVKETKTILVAEDEDNNFALIKAILSDSNIIITRALNGLEAVEKCKSEHIDIVLMDIKMPEMDGFEATKHIRSINIDLPVIAQTAYAHEKDKKRALESGFTDYIPKPIVRNTLLTLLGKYL